MNTSERRLEQIEVTDQLVSGSNTHGTNNYKLSEQMCSEQM